MEGTKKGVSNKRSTLVSTTQQVSQAAQDASKNILSASNGQSIGSTWASAIRTGISNQTASVKGAASSLGSGALSALWDAVGSGGSKFTAIGDAIAEGVARGIRNGSSKITSAARTAARSAYDAAKHELGISSPSKRMAEIGEFYDQGFAEGIEGGMDRVLRSARQLSALAASETAAGGAAYPSMGQPQIDYERLGEAVAEANRRAGLGNATIAVDGKVLGHTLEPSVSRATHQRAAKSANGRAARMVLV